MIEHQGEINNPYQQRKADKVVRKKDKNILRYFCIWWFEVNWRRNWKLFWMGSWGKGHRSQCLALIKIGKFNRWPIHIKQGGYSSQGRNGINGNHTPFSEFSGKIKTGALMLSSVGITDNLPLTGCEHRQGFMV